MKRYIQIIIASFFLAISTVSYAQYAGVEKFPMKNGLQKVKNGQFYGVENADGRVLVSVEYADFAFVNGIAILTKNNGTVHGYIRENGEVLMFNNVYEYHPQYPYYWDGYIPVRKISRLKDNQDSENGRWMFIDENEAPIRRPFMKKMNGVFQDNPNKQSKKQPKNNSSLTAYTFYKVNTFYEGYASVTTVQNQKIHIDSEGDKRFILPSKDEACYFRSTVYKGETVMLTSDGLKIYQEDPNTKEAIVKQTLLTGACRLYDNTKDSLRFNGGTLHLDLFGRADRFVPSNGDTFYFIEPPQKEKQRDTTIRDTVKFDLLKDIEIAFTNKVATANERANVTYRVNITNNSTVVSDSLTVTVMSGKTILKKQESVVVNPGEYSQVKFNMTARFPEEQQTRKVTVIVANKQADYEEPFTLTLKRWQREDW